MAVTEQIKKTSKEWYLANKDKVKEYSKQYISRNKTSFSNRLKQRHNSLGSGVYVACLGERILYVGQSIKLRKRIDEHNYISKNKHCSNSQLQEYIKQYNNKIEFVILENCTTDKLLEREQYYINLLKPEFNQI